MIDVLLQVVGAVAVAAAVSVVGVLILIAWTGSGEGDVNGDPERDAGAAWPPHESWDRGSRETIGRPCIGHAKASNKRALQRAVLNLNHE